MMISTPIPKAIFLYPTSIASLSLLSLLRHSISMMILNDRAIIIIMRGYTMNFG